MIELLLQLKDHKEVIHDEFFSKFNAEATLGQLKEKIQAKFQVEPDDQRLFYQNNEKILYPSSNTLHEIGLKNADVVVIKHSDLPWFNEYKESVESVLKNCPDKVKIAEEAVEHYERLTKSGFFKVYAKFNEFCRKKHSKVASWTDGVVGLMRKATEEYFHNIHDQKRGNEDSYFVCFFKKKDNKVGGRQTSTYAFIQLHGEDKLKKYYVKCHHYGPKGTSSGQVPDITEFYCYKLLELVGVGPKCHIIPPRMSTGSNTSTYICTQWDENFEIIQSVLNKNQLCVEVSFQLVVLRVLLFISDLHEENCGRWRETSDAAIVDFALSSNDFKVYSDIKTELLDTFPNSNWKKSYNFVKNQHDEKYLLEIAKIYMIKWDFLGKIEIAKDLIDPTKKLVKNLDVDFKKRNGRLSPTEQLIDYIDTLRKNVENLLTVLNSVI